MAIYDDGAGPEALQIFGHDDERRRDMWTPRLENIEPLRAEWDHFLDCIHTGNTPRSDALSGSLVVKIMERADRALQTRRRETIDWDGPAASRR
jgi:predicted dehydrogenase